MGASAPYMEDKMEYKVIDPKGIYFQNKSGERVFVPAGTSFDEALETKKNKEEAAEALIKAKRIEKIKPKKEVKESEKKGKEDEKTD